MSPSSNSNSNSDGGESKTIKFLYSYGGKILLRHSDGELRYVGGHTRVLAVDQSITFAELMVKFGDLCGSSMSLKCKLPNEDLDVLVSVTSDEDLANVVAEYDRAASSTHQDFKIRAILFPLKSVKKVSPPVSAVSSVDYSGITSLPYTAVRFRCSPTHRATASNRFGGRGSPPASGFPAGFQKVAGQFQHHPCCGQGSVRQSYFVPRWSHT